MEKSLCSVRPCCRCNFYKSVKNIPWYYVEIICIVIKLRLLAVCFVEVVHTVLCLVKRAHFMFMFAANTTRIMFRNVDLKCIQKLVQFGVLKADATPCDTCMSMSLWALSSEHRAGWWWCGCSRGMETLVHIQSETETEWTQRLLLISLVSVCLCSFIQHRQSTDSGYFS